MHATSMALMMICAPFGIGVAHAGCYNDFECGYGNKCVKATGDINITGVCVKPSDQFGNPKLDYSAPQPQPKKAPSPLAP